MNIISWLLDNVAWVFSGIGVALLSFVIKRRYANIESTEKVQQIESGKGSVNIQSVTSGDLKTTRKSQHIRSGSESINIQSTVNNEKR